MNRIKKKHIQFTREGDVEVFVSQSKTDETNKGFSFTMSGRNVDGFSVKKS